MQKSINEKIRTKQSQHLSPEAVAQLNENGQQIVSGLNPAIYQFNHHNHDYRDKSKQPSSEVKYL